MVRFPQRIEIVVSPEMFGHNAQTGWATVHGIGLKIMRKFWHINL